jgi:hypothetical protein
VDAFHSGHVAAIQFDHEGAKGTKKQEEAGWRGIRACLFLRALRAFVLKLNHRMAPAL